MYRSFVLPPPLRSSLAKLKLIFKTHHPLIFYNFYKYFYVFILINIYILLLLFVNSLQLFYDTISIVLV